MLILKTFVFCLFLFPKLLGMDVPEADTSQKEHSSGINKLAQKSFGERRIEGFVASKILKITDRYNVELSGLLHARDAWKNEKIYRDSRNKSKTIISSGGSQLVSHILLDLWNRANFYGVLRCIKAITFAKDSYVEMIGDERIDTVDHVRFFKLLNQPFYHSRTLFGLGIVPQLILLHDRNFCPDRVIATKRRVDGTGALERKPEDIMRIVGNTNSQCCKFSQSNEYTFECFEEKSDAHHIAILHNKARGGQFGGIFKLGEKKYFVKAYFGYPAKPNLNSEIAIDITTSGIMSSDVVEDGKPESEYLQVIFKELFTYKFLELIGLGPKVHFLVNPYIKDGLFIATEDVNSATETFVEIGSQDEAQLHILINAKLITIRMSGINEDAYEGCRALIDMLEVDTINRILTLNDFNTGNFGYLIFQNEDEDLDIEDEDLDIGDNWLKKQHKFMIIDFLPSIKGSDRYLVNDIGETFLSGNSVTKYDVSSIMYAAINRNMENERFHKGSKSKKDKLKEKHRAEKLFFGRLVMERLNGERFQGSLQAKLCEARDFVENFLFSRISGTSAQQLLGLSDEYVRTGIDDINLYIAGIQRNYQFLRYFINNQGQQAD